MMINSLLNDSRSCENNLFLRDTSHDVPERKRVTTLARLAVAVAPLLSCHPSLRLPVAAAMGTSRVINSQSKCSAARAVITLACSLFHFSIGGVVTAIDDIALDLYSFKRETSHKMRLYHLLKATTHLAAIAAKCSCKAELVFLSYAMQTVVLLLDSIKEFKRDRFIEGTGHLLMAGIRLQETHSQWEILKKSGRLEVLIEKWISCLYKKEPSKYGDTGLLADLFVKRHSGKEFTDHPLSQDQINALVQAARWTPSSYNDQPWNFVLCNKETHPEAHKKLVETIYGQEWAEAAPLLVLSVVRPEFRYNHKPNDWALYDTGAAALGMSLQATKMGLMAHQIGGFDPEAAAEEFHLPKGYQPISIIAIGYEKAAPTPAEEAERVRLPIKDNFFFGNWG